ncbi:hypothetical protein [Paenibacillus turpanensis]|uniref:hypothetical protein n=1 Tax=Paenibacillus turpanensis TaxID=2689078 RepID=UPI00140C65AC|nr:hypothetical protein [Paenibacillus turpanensis]
MNRNGRISKISLWMSVIAVFGGMSLFFVPLLLDVRSLAFFNQMMEYSLVLSIASLILGVIGFFRDQGVAAKIMACSAILLNGVIYMPFVYVIHRLF